MVSVHYQYKGYSNYSVKGCGMEKKENLFSIGEVARYQNISKQTLIFYDKAGVFRPAWVDPENGYRYYSASQLDYLDTILIMKQIGFSLQEIKAHMQHYDLDSSLAMLRRQLDVIDRKVAELKLVRSRVQNRCDQMEAARAHCAPGQPGIELEDAPAQDLFCLPVQAPYTLREISIATKQCFARAAAEALPVFFQCGVVVPLEKIRAGRCTEASLAFLPIERGGPAEQVRRLPAGRRACIYHVGDYLSEGQSYQKLLDWCGEHRLRIVSDAYEFCINDYLTTHDESEYITKIAVYVEEE